MNWPDLAWYVSAACMATGLIGAVCSNAARRLRDQERELKALHKAYTTQGEQLAANRGGELLRAAFTVAGLGARRFSHHLGKFRRRHDIRDSGGFRHDSGHEPRRQP